MIFIEGHAIVSQNGMIADERGEMPACLKRKADWDSFQAALDKASVVVLGSHGHLRHPNPGRKRLVVTSKVQAPLVEGLATFWNPAIMPFYKLGLSGVIAVTGGKRVFDLFLNIGFDRFILSEVPEVIPLGIPCFSTGHPREVFSKAGLKIMREASPEAHLVCSEWIKP